jgi:predicted metalloendopeptidase
LGGDWLVLPDLQHSIVALWIFAAASCLPGSLFADDRAITPFAGMDSSVAPGQDFFRYANGGWLAQTQIPADRSSFGTWGELDELTTQRTADLIRSAAAKLPPDRSDARKIADYYSSFLDEGAIEAKGMAPIASVLARINAINNRRALAEFLGTTLRADVDVLNATSLHTGNVLGLWVAQDLDDPAHYCPFLLQGGLDLPDRDYYLDPGEKMAAIRRQYAEYVTRMLALAGINDAGQRANRIIALETKIARSHSSRADTEDVRKGNNHWPSKEFAKRAPGMDWEAFFKGARLSRAPTFTVWQPDAVRGLAALVGSEPLDVWQDYLRFHEIDRAANYLPRSFDAASFEFYGKVLSGTPEQRPRWKRAVAETSDALGEAVGRLYVEKYFPASEKARAEEMVRNLLAAFSARIDSLQWMDPKTKVKAKAKLATLKVGVGYPDHWRDYSALVIHPADAFGNHERAEQFEYARSLAKLGKPVDRSEWVMNPQTVNAVNLPAMNALNFPAAILQPPYFDPNRPLCADYGAAGALMGHEISHSFDDQGALFDATGRLANWWTDADFAHFQAAGAALARQYDGYHPFPDIAVNGRQTLSENIADLAGLAVAFDAYRLANSRSKAPVVGGFTADQQFFLSYAQYWCDKQREAALRLQIVTDGHAPPEYRADTVRNLDAWYDAFPITEHDALYLPPSARVRVW